MCFFFFKKKTAYEMRISDGSSDVCSSDRTELYAVADDDGQALADWLATHPGAGGDSGTGPGQALHAYLYHHRDGDAVRHLFRVATGLDSLVLGEPQILGQVKHAWATAREAGRSEEHTSELQSLMRISYAVFCLKKKKQQNQ